MLILLGIILTTTLITIIILILIIINIITMIILRDKETTPANWAVGSLLFLRFICPYLTSAAKEIEKRKVLCFIYLEHLIIVVGG